MTSPISKTASTASPGPMVHPTAVPCLRAGEQTGMTHTQAIVDTIHALEAELAGKRMELAMAQGRREVAKEHMQAMHKAINARREFRLSIGLADDGCFFNAAGHADQVLGAVANA